MKELDEYLCKNKDQRFRVTKLQARPGKERMSGIGTGETFIGQVTLKFFEDQGAILMMDGGWTMRTSLIREALQKSPTKWLLRTMNSVYRVELE